MNETVVELKNIRKSYGKREVLRDVSFSMKKGDICVLTGKSSQGKTTVMKCILGLTDFSSGSLSLMGCSSLSGRFQRSDRLLRRQRQRVGFYIGKGFFDYMTGRQNLRYYCRLKGMKDHKIADKAIALVGLEDVKIRVNHYSLGMRQRLGIACAIMGDPEIILLDEPFAGLDPFRIAQIWSVLQGLSKEKQITILVTSPSLPPILEGELDGVRHLILENGTVREEKWELKQ